MSINQLESSSSPDFLEQLVQIAIAPSAPSLPECRREELATGYDAKSEAGLSPLALLAYQAKVAGHPMRRFSQLCSLVWDRVDVIAQEGVDIWDTRPLLYVNMPLSGQLESAYDKDKHHNASVESLVQAVVQRAVEIGSGRAYDQLDQTELITYRTIDDDVATWKVLPVVADGVRPRIERFFWEVRTILMLSQ